MVNITTLILFIALVFSSLFLVSYVNRRQLRAKLLSQKIEQMKRRVTDLEEIGASVEPLVESVAIPRLINQETLNLIRKILSIAPKNQLLEINLQNAEERDKALANKPESICYRMQESDAAIARSHFFLNEAGLIIRKWNAQGLIEAAEMEAYIQELSWSHLMVSVISHVGQGHKAIKNNDPLRAAAFYKKAQQFAMQSNSSDERRQRVIKEISEIMSNRRREISIDLMPETHLNPNENDVKLITPVAKLASGDQNNASA